jgi:hypothetical protein
MAMATLGNQQSPMFGPDGEPLGPNGLPPGPVIPPQTPPGGSNTIPIEPLSQNLQGAINTPDTVSLTGFDLQAGVTYAFIAAGKDDGGGTLPNPDMAVFGSDGGKIAGAAWAYNDDSFLSHDPLIQFTPQVSGEYIVAVGGLGGTGTFSLQVTPAGAPFGHDLGNIGAS